VHGFWAFLAYNLAPCFIKMNYNRLKLMNLRFSASPKYEGHFILFETP
jgi:hypothetical protein